ncbi:MAG TPA: hypothetical protein VGR35_11810 [Tepidisphaeraceae bacterium]|nr:hypothetical protein [Tepidisphaeraceae bacterium]
MQNEDQEAIRQQAVAAINFVQAGKKALADAIEAGDEEAKNTALIDGIRRFAMSVRELNIDLIDAINPFGDHGQIAWRGAAAGNCRCHRGPENYDPAGRSSHLRSSRPSV